MQVTKTQIRNYCNTCFHDTNHHIIAGETVNGSNDYQCATEYLLVKCMGCGTISFREDFYDYEYPDHDEDGDIIDNITTRNYPKFVRDHRPLKEAWRLPSPISNMYEEALQSLTVNCKTLSGVGFRAIIEAICIDKNIKGKNLEIKINNLAKGGFITKQESDRLHSVRFLGNDSIHNIIQPKPEQLATVLRIMENLLTNIYLLDIEVDSRLDTPINDYKKFIELVYKRTRQYNGSNELTIQEILGKDIRRVKDNIETFENDLIADIKSGKFQFLTIGDCKANGNLKNVQHYSIVPNI